MGAGDHTGPTTREAVAVFESEDELLKVVDELQSAGFDHADFSVMPPWKDVEEKIGHELRSVEEAEDDPEIPRAVPVDKPALLEAEGALIGIPLYVGTCIAIIGAAAKGAAIGAIAISGLSGGVIGGAIGVALAYGLKSRHERTIREQLKHGGLLLWVHLRDQEHEDRARKILARYDAHDLHMHGVYA